MNKIRFVDTTLRDGPQSLWAESKRTGKMAIRSAYNNIQVQRGEVSITLEKSVK